MRALLNIIFFVICVLASFTWFSNSIPQLQAEPPTEEEVSLEGMTMDSFVALGKKIFLGKGTCTLCHNAVGHRAPLLDIASADGPAIGARSIERLKDSRYVGKATTGEEYIRESMLEPSAFVVSGFGKPGTNDTKSPMPIINKGAIGLSDIEIDAVISFFQSVAGVDITVILPTGEVEVEEDEPEDSAAVRSMAELASKYECRLCHMIPGLGMEEDEAELGPDFKNLTRFAKKAPNGLKLKEYLRQSILDPNAYIVKIGEFEEDTMPPDFADRLRISELDVAVEYLAAIAEGRPLPEPPKEEEEEGTEGEEEAGGSDESE